MRGLAATGIAATALVLVAAALYLHRGDTADDSTATPARGDAAWKGASAVWPGREPTTRVGARRAQAGVAEPTTREAAQVDQQKLGSLYQAAAALALMTQDPNMTRPEIKELIETLESELSAAQAQTPAEAQMVGFYAQALVAYRDGLQFWDLRRFADRPGESPALDALAAKYGIHPVPKLSYTATWQGYPNAFSKIWAVGNTAAAQGTALYDR